LPPKLAASRCHLRRDPLKEAVGACVGERATDAGPANRKSTIDVAERQDSPKLAAAAAQAHGREELYPGMGASRPSTDIAPVGTRPVFPLMLILAGSGARTAAMLLPLYYLADSTITLLRRAVNRESVWQAHRSHFYQRATDRGFRVTDVVARVLFVNLALTALAFATILLPSRTTDIAALTAGSALVAWLLIVFARGPRRADPRLD
jgi:hypothetical protein